MKFKTTILAVLALLISTFTYAREYQGGSKKSGSGSDDAIAANCAPPVGWKELSINNVRAMIQTGGDMWWDLVGVPQYEIPKNSGKTSLFAGSLWLGGRDASGQLKVAALRFRQVGMDFWTGPLSTITAEIEPTTCDLWDTHFKSTRTEVDAFVAGTGEATEVIKTWPAHGDPSRDEAAYLAPFFDVDGDGYYNYAAGDYPGYDLSGNVECGGQLVNIYGDENLWWIFNDKGNIHTETGGQAIGMEIRAQAFSFATNDEVNNMTFYNYELVNRSSFDLRDTYFGFWVDPDLGNAQDDYVGCDVERGLGFCYNGDEFDEDNSGRPGYGENPPAIGVDFFQGPFQDADGKDNCLCDNYADAIADDGIVYSGSGVGYGDGIVDNERLGMRAFLYHNNDNSDIGDPRVASDYYNFLRSIWKDNSLMYYGGTGHQNSGGVIQPLVEADFMFPDNSDPKGWGTGGAPQAPWTEVTAGNVPADRRFVQSAGPFGLAPGAINNITVGVVWAQANSGGAAASVQAMKQADSKTQALFDNCFQLLDGPDAPTVSINEMDKQLVFQLSNEGGNNANDDYFEIDPFIVAPTDSIQDDNGDWVSKEDDPILFDSLVTEYRSYRFQGYQVYQLKDASVSAADLYNDDRARLVFQCDIKDDVTRLINYRYDLDLQSVVPELRVDEATNDGVYKSFTVTEDFFATGDRRLVNYKTYYYMAIAYAHNEYKEYSQVDANGLDGQRTPYLPSRKAPTGPIARYSGIPHFTNMQNQGTTLNSTYGDFVPVTRIEGIGNNGHALQLDQASHDKVMEGAPYKVSNPTYTVGDIAGLTNTPIEVKIIDPLQVKGGDYVIAYREIDDAGLDYAYWDLTGGALGNDTISSSTSINAQKEELIPSLGISITIKNAENAWYDKFNNGFIGASIVYDDFNSPWLGGVPSTDGNSAQNWIRSGVNAEDGQEGLMDYDMGIDNNGSRDGTPIDEDEVYENVIEGVWAPARLGTWNVHGPMATRGASNTTETQKKTNWEKMMESNLSLDDAPTHAGIQLSFLNSVDIVFTKDKSKWTRVVVVEMQDDATLSDSNALKLSPRKHKSVDKNGLTVDDAGYNAAEGDLVSSQGMGWFPGYAIDIETGDRLNMAFGEDSYIVSENGNDMLWNPTDVIYEGLSSNRIRFGGKHYVYVFRNNDVEEHVNLKQPLDYNFPENRMPSYDMGEFMYKKLATGVVEDFYHVYRSAMWVGLPTLTFNEELLSNTAVVQLRVNKKHAKWAEGTRLSIGDEPVAGVEYLVERGPVVYNSKEYVRGDNFVGIGNGIVMYPGGTTGSDNQNNIVATINGGRPTYGFSLDGLGAETNKKDVLSESLNKIRIVPNPYYAYSEYEQDKNDFQVKITNLPQKCKVRIYTLNGVLVREFEKDDDSVTYLNWDLKNHARIQVASGMYLVHVEVPDVGEVVLKWFGALRPVDLDSF
ncbi:MAG: T9SS type A sorting domain-containing protein [Salibacteraceae bacterium]